jgi:hypothetical protein
VVSAAEIPWPLIFFNLNFLSSSSIFILTRAEWTPFETDCYSENLVDPGVEPGTSASAARNSDHETTEAVGSGSYWMTFPAVHWLSIVKDLHVPSEILMKFKALIL